MFANFKHALRGKLVIFDLCIINAGFSKIRVTCHRSFILLNIVSTMVGPLPGSASAEPGLHIKKWKGFKNGIKWWNHIRTR